MVEVAPTTEENPSRRRRDSWNLRNIVEDVTGRTIEDLQEPGRPAHPFLQSAPPSPTVSPAHRLSVGSPSVPANGGAASEDPDEPVGRIHPPLIGELGRSYHGEQHEHHAPTLTQLERAAEPQVPGSRPHAPGPSRRPERIYLHYLLLHMDRLSDTALLYLRHAVEEEAHHRQL